MEQHTASEKATPKHEASSLSIAVLLCVAEGENEIAREAVRALSLSFAKHRLRFFIVDDASRSMIGADLAAFCSTLGHVATYQRLPRSLGFRGCPQRTCLGMNAAISCGEPFDLFIKQDPDALVIRNDLGDFVSDHCRDRGKMWGLTFTQRLRDRVLFVADLLPFGFRRKVYDGCIGRRWELRRTRPVWWFRFGWRALANGYRFSLAGGGFYIISMDLLYRMKQLGYLENATVDGHGFVCEEDLIANLLVLAVGGSVVDLNSIQTNWGDLAVGKDLNAEILINNRFYVVHPLKSNPSAKLCRQAIWSALDRRRGC